MFLLVPLFHEGASRAPKLTLGLIFLNLSIFFVAWPLQVRANKVVTSSHLADAAAPLVKIALSDDSFLSGPEKDRLARDVASPDFPASSTLATIDKIDEMKVRLDQPGRYHWTTFHDVFEAQRAAWIEAPDQTTPYHRFGYSAAAGLGPRLFTHQFLHYGIFHLLGNMLFLWVIGAVLEHHHSCRIIAIFLLGGAVAALIQRQIGLPNGEMMVGASGSISALIGYGLTAFPRERVRLFYLLILAISPRSGQVSWPLWVCVPLWVIAQLLLLQVPAQGGAQIAYGAHLGGAALGAALGLAERWTAPAFSNA